MAIPPSLRLTFDDTPAPEDVAVLVQGLVAFNERNWPDIQPSQLLRIFLRDGGKVVAGLAGHCYGGWLFIAYLWVSEHLRRQGIGRELMAEAERRARERGCHSVWLDTYSFQASGFYHKLGYEIFGTLDCPPDRKRYFLQKRLADPGEPS